MKTNKEKLCTTLHNKSVAGKFGHETMNTKLTKLEIVKEVSEIATASYEKRWQPL